MIELYILGTLSAMGYLLNKSSKDVQTKSGYVNVNEMPTQDNIYSSKYYEQVKKHEERKAAKMHALSKRPKKTNVISKNYGIDATENSIPSSTKVKSLTGDYVDASEFTHNNMVPYFGGNIKQNMDEHSSKTILENYTGVSDIFKNKQEVPCMYDNKRDFGYVNGMDNKGDFYRERMVQSRAQNNVVPVPQIRVGPGLNQGYDASPIGGYQQLDMLEIIRPKTVDELRVASKPKLTFEGRTVDGQKSVLRAEAPNLVKNRVETFFEQTPDMLLKTTGAFTKPTEIPEFNVKNTHRNETSREEIGTAYAAVNKPMLHEENVKRTTRQQFNEFGLRNTALNTYGRGEKDDYGKSKILVYNNERDVTSTRVYQGNVTSMVKAIVKPLEDALKITKKQHAVDNPRHFGNMNIQVPSKLTIHDPNDIARTTIKETLIHDDHVGVVSGPKRLIMYDPDEVARTTGRETLDRMDYELNLGTTVPKATIYDPEDTLRTTMKETLIDEKRNGNIDRLDGMGTYVNDYMAKHTQKEFISDKDYIGIANRENADGYQTTKYEAKHTQKEFISDNDYYGTAASATEKKPTSMESTNNAVITERKEVTLFGREPTQTGVKVAITGDNINMLIKKSECDNIATRHTPNQTRIVDGKIPSFSDVNLTKDKKHYNVPDERLDPTLLKAFHENPYTQSLTSAF